MGKKSFCGQTGDQIEPFLRENGYETSCSAKILTDFYRRRIHDFNLYDNIPRQLRQTLGQAYTTGLYKPVDRVISGDGTVKYLFRSPSSMEFESVVIPDNDRLTICISTQSGCRMGCPFCLTGQYGFKGDLTAGDMINQVLSVDDSTKINRIVFMGMGEPLDNLDEVLKACEILTSSWGLAHSPAAITVSTVGIMPAVEIFLKRTRCNLTLSLFSPFSSQRSEVIPAERMHPAGKIITILKNFPKERRRISIAYIMLEGINDTDRHLEGIIRLLSGSSIRVNLLPYHRTGDNRFKSPGDDRIQYFRQNLASAGIPASIRRSRGADISAACGLLAAGKSTR